MNKLHKVVIAVLMVFTWAQTGLAQNAEDVPKAVPVELYACEWREGKDMGDLQSVIGKWNKWADSNMPRGYSAWTITPQFRSSDSSFGVGWIGAWQNGNVMGEAMTAYRQKGGNLQAEFDKVVDCANNHALFSSVALRSTAGSVPLPNPLVQFSSCTLEEGKTQTDAYNMHKKLVNKMAEMGSTAAVWLFYPMLGAGDIDFDYMLVVGHQNYAELGKGVERYLNDGGWKVAEEAMAGITSCDSPRLYDGKLVRNGAAGS